MPGMVHYVGPVGGLDWKSSLTTIPSYLNENLTNRDVQCCEMLLSISLSTD